MDADEDPPLPRWRVGLNNLVEAFLPEMNFITLHYAYFILTSLLAGLVFWGSSTPFGSVSFTDSLFLCASAMTEAGLNTINLSTLNTWQQIMLFVLIMMGSAIFVSIFVVFVRLHAFDREFRRTIQARRLLRRRTRALARGATSRRRRSNSGLFGRHDTPAARDLPLSPLRPADPTPALPLDAADIHQQPGDTKTTPRRHGARPIFEEFDPDGLREGLTVKLKLPDNDPPRRHLPPDESLRETGRAATPSEQPLELPPPIVSLNNEPECEGQSPVAQAQRREVTAAGIHSDSAPPTRGTLGTMRTAERSIHFQASPVSPARHVEPSPSGFALQRSMTQTSHASRNAGNQAERMRPSFFSFTGVGATAASSLGPRLPSRATFESNLTLAHAGPHAERPASRWFPSAAGHFTRNSGVYGLTLEERQELGGREYYAILFLSFLVPIYFVLWQLLGAIALGAWIENNRASTATANGINPWWVGVFNAISAFNNSGMSLLDANATAFQDSVFLLLSMGLFILAGNTAYPIFLRIIIWTFWKLLPDGDYWRHEKETLRFLLDHPRRCYTNLFPRKHTWWLGLTLIALNGIDWAMFEILNIGNSAITELDDGIEALDGLFQALAVRSGGFYVVPIASTRISLQVLYVIMMFISAYPVALTMRNSNVYEERSLGLFTEDLQEQRDQKPEGPAADSKSLDATSVRPATNAGGVLANLRWVTQAQTREETTAFLRQQLRAQLSHDAWWLALAVFLISIIENESFVQDPAVYSLFNILFEVVSGYACCGISVGVPFAAYSFCGTWHVVSKLIMVAVMIRGRHRGLPVAIDHAVQLPGRRAWEAEEEDGRLRFERSTTFTDA